MADETLMTDGQGTQVADQQQAASAQTEGQQAAGGEQAAQQQQATEGQNTEGQQAEGAKTEGEQAKPEGAPEKYEFKPVEGVTLDDAVIGAFSEVAKGLNLTQDAAQKVLDKMGPVIASRQMEQIAAVQTAWADSAKADKEFGGDKLQENLGTAKKALEEFGSPELRTLLNDSGMGNHPEVIRAFYRIGKAMSQDSVVTGRTPSMKSAADVLYDKSSK
ncbi:MAG: hypothetical protein ACYCW7_00335 [Pseudomonadaceae bacterium]